MATALQCDPAYALSWQANIAMPILDGANGKLTPAEASAIADRLMSHLWGVSSNNAVSGGAGAPYTPRAGSQSELKGN